MLNRHFVHKINWSCRASQSATNNPGTLTQQQDISIINKHFKLIEEIKCYFPSSRDYRSQALFKRNELRLYFKKGIFDRILNFLSGCRPINFKFRLYSKISIISKLDRIVLDHK
ncbi:uncharacterized protein OCT59_029181 [Rhizophagus irregularis]|uniref:uncharacterized protein n=1 Tax=Rhizophagus irregularis TaxID=588596 RepID=UPI00332AA561|nr:hypothetical protein OCT59_029181 [Rhizophagus irregularis]